MEAGRALISDVLGWRELGLAALLFTVLAFVVFGWYAFHGGFVADDWVNADRYYFHDGSGFWGAVDNYQTPSRPVAAVYVTLTYALLGTHYDQHLVLSVLLAAFLSTTFYAFLRTVGVAMPWALAAAALLLVFPSSDSTRFWSTGSQINLFIGLYLLAAVVAIRGRRRYGPDPTLPAVATQALASLLAVTAVAGYEIVAPAVLLSVVLYRLTCGRGGEVWRWALDAIPTLLVLWFYTRKFGDSAGISQLLSNVKLVADGGISVLGYSLLPFRTTPRWTLFGLALAVIVAVAVLGRVLPSERDRKEIGRWLKPLLFSVAAIAIGYAMIVPVAERYPLYAPGVQNRTNCFAALGICTLIVFLAGAVSSMIVAALPGIVDRARPWYRAAFATIGILGILVAYTVRINQDADRWVLSADVQEEIFDGTKALLPSPPDDATIFTSPYAGYSSPSLPILGGGGNNDAIGAFKVLYDSSEIRAFPLLEGNGIECGPSAASTPDAGNSETEYGKVFLVDLRAQKVYRPADRAECLADTAAMEPFGPVNLRNDW